MTKNNKKMTQNNSRRPRMTKNDAKKKIVSDQPTNGPTNRPTEPVVEFNVFALGVRILDQTAMALS